MIGKWLCARLGLKEDTGPEAVEVRALTDQFYITLQAYITKIEGAGEHANAPALSRIKKILEKPPEERRWSDAYDIEQQIVHLFDRATLDAEFGRRMVEADQALHRKISAWYRERAQESMNLEEKRAVLLRMVNDIQWRYTKDEASRGYIKQITKRTEFVFMLAVIVFAVAVFVVIFGQQHKWVGHVQLFMPFAGICGVLGATFSMMISLRSRLASSSFDDLKLNSSWGLILARALVGFGAALILYFFMKSGLLRGDMFPSEKGLEPVIAAVDLGKLVIWCFLAGFSEKLVPNLLSRTEQAAERPQTPTLPQTLPHGDRAAARAVPSDEEGSETDGRTSR